MKKKIRKLKKAEIAEEYIAVRKARNVKTTKQDAVAAVADFYQVLENLLGYEDIGITLGKLGVLYNGLQKQRMGVHPQDGTPLVIPQLRTIKFKPAPKHKNDMNNHAD